jgi:glycosyltransferase involved in cell wall biosynthesis
MRILLWHVHGAWTTAFVQGRHEYVVPMVAGRGPDGLGLARTYDWPDTVTEVPLEQLGELHFDAVIYQRPHELQLLPPRDGTQAIYVEHNAPQGAIADMRHPVADRVDLTLVHVTHFNALFWDAGATPTRVIEHGIVDPGPRYTGELPRAAVVINEARRRGRVTGTDLLDHFRAVAPIDLFGIDAPALGGEDLPQAELHDAMARRRVYLHPIRWTSLGLSLLEAMHLGMPVVVLGTTEAFEAVGPEAGVVSTRVHVLADAVRRLANDPDEARARGALAREHVLRRYGLDRFLDDWDAVLAPMEVTR